MTMNVLIIADMEGVTGLAHLDECVPGSSSYDNGVRLLCNEVNILAAAAFRADATGVSVIDWHGGGGNLKPHMLDHGVNLVAEDLSVGYDAAILSGFHAMRGTDDGFISHTMYGRSGLKVAVDGRDVGELWLLSRWLGSHDIPVILVSGDDAAIREANRDLAGTLGLAVKTARSYSEADVLPVGEAHARLAAGVTTQLRAPGKWARYTVEPPIRFRLAFERSPGPIDQTRLRLQEDSEGRLVGTAASPQELVEVIDAIGALPATS